MFYLKYRPKTIDEIDNSKVRDEIGKILSTKNIPHAFLFVGPKGTGKTSTARIVAKSLNCLNQPKSPKPPISQINHEPCNNCKNCKSIDSSSSVDVLEMDAASNRGIDDVRSLIKESNFLPMAGVYRVFIIDEAHMITTEAFNALLKTLEEPPESVIFILATTNEEKLPKTIKSRCLILNFGKARNIDIEKMLRRIIDEEKLKVDGKLVSLIVKHSDHSFRDAAKILEELAIQNKLTLAEGEKFLGVFQQNFLQIVCKNDIKKSLGWIEEFDTTGGSFKSLIEQLLQNLHELLLAKNGLLSESDLDLDFSLAEIIRLMKLLTEAYNNLKISPIESLPLEIAIAEFYNGRKS